MSEDKYDEAEVEDIVRVSFNLPRELHTRLNNIMPWGTKSNFFRKIVEIAVDRVEVGGAPILGAIFKGDFDPFQKGK